MRISDLIPLAEMALPSEVVKTTRYYHGTASEIFAKKIMKQGIQPPSFVMDNGKKQNSHLTPVEGKVYITPSIAYAQIYAIGGNVAGNPSLRVRYKGNESKFDYYIKTDPADRHYGRYGYVFVINGSQLADIQPDEDSIGEFLGQILCRESTIEFMDPFEANRMRTALADSTLVGMIKYLAGTHLADSTLRRIKDGEYSYMAKAGKVLVKRMPDWAKVCMVEYGFHCAHTGPLIPDEVWKIDKTKIGWLVRDGSNFFEIAKRVR
jgi:hypothetical protein